MNGPFQNLQTVIKGASGVVAIVPGVALLARATHLPPNLQTLLGSLAVSLGVTVVLAVFLLRHSLKRLSAKIVALIMIPTGLLGAVIAIFFVVFAMTHVIVTGAADGSEIYILVPLRPSGDLETLVAPLQYDWVEALANPAISARVQMLMHQQSSDTAWLLTGSLLVAQTFLLAALITGAWKVADGLQQAGPKID